MVKRSIALDTVQQGRQRAAGLRMSLDTPPSSVATNVRPEQCCTYTSPPKITALGVGHYYYGLPLADKAIRSFAHDVDNIIEGRKRLDHTATSCPFDGKRQSLRQLLTQVSSLLCKSPSRSPGSVESYKHIWRTERAASWTNLALPLLLSHSRFTVRSLAESTRATSSPPGLLALRRSHMPLAHLPYEGIFLL
jgi:hypothetical protein